MVHGPSHAEVMWLENEDAPCLVEIGCRYARPRLRPFGFVFIYGYANKHIVSSPISPFNPIPLPLTLTHLRPHGGDGVHTELARRCIGYSQLDAMLGLLLPSKEEEEERKGEDATPAGRTQHDISIATTAILPFDALPPRQPRPLQTHAEVVMLVAHRSGRLLGYPGLPTVRALRSFQVKWWHVCACVCVCVWGGCFSNDRLYFSYSTSIMVMQDVALKVQPGEMLHATVDYLTNPGWVMLVHEDASVVAADAAAIHALAMREAGGLYAVEGDNKGGGVEEEEEDEGETSEEEETPPTSP